MTGRDDARGKGSGDALFRRSDAIAQYGNLNFYDATTKGWSWQDNKWKAINATENSLIQVNNGVWK